MKITLCLLMVVYVVAEPPVDTRYLPPQQGFSGSLSPSREYGVPGFGNRQGNGIRRPSTSYGPPSRAPQNTYLPPSSRRANAQFSPRPQNNYLPPTRGSQLQSQYQRQPSPQYGAPNALPSTQYSAPISQPSSQYGAPNALTSTQYGAPISQPSTQYGAPSSQLSTQYGAPNAQPSTQYGAPNAQLGKIAPSQEYGGFARDNNLARADITSADFDQSRQYLPPGRGGYDDGSNGEPANYSFEYMVKDEPSGNDFGHRESRQGDRAEGLYYVLLPDGRKQTVEYEADQDGYKPRISYEDTGIRTDYNRNGQGYDDYSSGPY